MWERFKSAASRERILNRPLRPVVPKLPKKKPYFTLEYQFRLAEQALHEARNLVKAQYYTSAIGHAYQVAHRSAAGLLFALEARVDTERDVGIGFEAAFVSNHRTDAKFGKLYRKLADMRHKSDFDFDYVANEADGKEALSCAEEFWVEAQRLRDVITVGA
jgi:uncharacterized protein (UPF0332 family)